MQSARVAAVRAALHSNQMWLKESGLRTSFDWTASLRAKLISSLRQLVGFSADGAMPGRGGSGPDAVAANTAFSPLLAVRFPETSETRTNWTLTLDSHPVLPLSRHRMCKLTRSADIPVKFVCRFRSSAARLLVANSRVSVRHVDAKAKVRHARSIAKSLLDVVSPRFVSAS